MSLHTELVRAVAAAIEASYRKGEPFKFMARAAISVMNPNVKSRRILKKALDAERRRNEKMAAKLAATFPTEHRRDDLGEIRTLCRAPEGYRIVRRTGCCVASFVMTDEEWNRRLKPVNANRS